jgi:hypothetical protein
MAGSYGLSNLNFLRNLYTVFHKNGYLLDISLAYKMIAAYLTYLTRILRG